MRQRLRRTPHTRGAGARRRPDNPRTPTLTSAGAGAATTAPGRGPGAKQPPDPGREGTAGQGGLARLICPVRNLPPHPGRSSHRARPATFPPRDADAHRARHRARLRLPPEEDGAPASFSTASFPASLSGAGEGAGSFLRLFASLPRRAGVR